MAAYRAVNFRVVYHFLHWHLNQKVSPSGRKTQGVKSKSSLITFWCLYRLAFERARAHKIDKVIDGRRLSNVQCPQFVFLPTRQPCPATLLSASANNILTSLGSCRAGPEAWPVQREARE